MLVNQVVNDEKKSGLRIRQCHWNEAYSRVLRG